MATETFRGEHYPKLDAKGRTMLPSSFRSVFQFVDTPPDGAGFQLLLVYGGRDREFVEGFTEAGAADLARRLKQLTFGSREHMLAKAIFVEQSIEVETDKDGRFSPPLQVREKLGLPKEEVELAFIGSGESFQIWRADVYKAKRKARIDALEAELLGTGPAAADPLALLMGTT